MTNLHNIGKTISQELQKAIDAAMAADAALADSIMQDMNTAYKSQQDGLAQVEEIEKQVALLVRESIDIRTRVDNEFYDAMAVFRKAMGALRGVKLVAPKLKALEGGK